MRRSRRNSYLTQSYETNSSKEKGELSCGGHPHIPRQGLRPCNPLLALADERSSPVVGRSLVGYYAHTERVPPNLNTDPTLVVMPAHGASRNRQVIVVLILESVDPQFIRSRIAFELAPHGRRFGTMSGSPACSAATKPEPRGWLITMRPIAARISQLERWLPASR